MDKKVYIPKVIEWVKRNGFEQIRANLEGYEMPIAYEPTNSHERLIPDVTAKLLFEKSYFEVVVRTKEVDKTALKLQLLSILASYKGGQLYLMAPQGHYNFAKTLLLKNTINGKIVKID
ncbi:hypothetical protein [Runella sp.]|uniref:hypothetical protein n=1 Tax=Runella sp. TaxID=1960881 RepID=UPI003D0F2E44